MEPRSCAEKVAFSESGVVHVRHVLAVDAARDGELWDGSPTDGRATGEGEGDRLRRGVLANQYQERARITEVAEELADGLRDASLEKGKEKAAENDEMRQFKECVSHHCSPFTGSFLIGMVDARALRADAELGHTTDGEAGGAAQPDDEL